MVFRSRPENLWDGTSVHHVMLVQRAENFVNNHGLVNIVVCFATYRGRADWVPGPGILLKNCIF